MDNKLYKIEVWWHPGGHSIVRGLSWLGISNKISGLARMGLTDKIAKIEITDETDQYSDNFGTLRSHPVGYTWAEPTAV